MMNQDKSGASSSAQPQQPASRGGRTLLYVGVAAAVVVVLVALLALSLGPGSSVALTQNRSENSTALYLSPSQASALLGSQLADYNASDLYNPLSPLNMSDLVGLVPQLYGNATSGWVTSADGANSTRNTSVQYIEIITSNASGIAGALGSAMVSGLGIAPSEVNSGVSDGLNYTYGSYQNSTDSFQLLYGWKGNGVVLAMFDSNPGFSVNESALVGIAANDTP